MMILIYVQDLLKNNMKILINTNDLKINAKKRNKILFTMKKAIVIIIIALTSQVNAQFLGSIIFAEKARDSSLIDILGSNTSIYNNICFQAMQNNLSEMPYLEDWIGSWDTSGAETLALAQLVVMEDGSTAAA